MISQSRHLALVQCRKKLLLYYHACEQQHKPRRSIRAGGESACRCNICHGSRCMARSSGQAHLEARSIRPWITDGCVRFSRTLCVMAVQCFGRRAEWFFSQEDNWVLDTFPEDKSIINEYASSSLATISRPFLWRKMSINTNATRLLPSMNGWFLHRWKP